MGQISTHYKKSTTRHFIIKNLTIFIGKHTYVLLIFWYNLNSYCSSVALSLAYSRKPQTHVDWYCLLPLIPLQLGPVSLRCFGPTSTQHPSGLCLHNMYFIDLIYLFLLCCCNCWTEQQKTYANLGAYLIWLNKISFFSHPSASLIWFIIKTFFGGIVGLDKYHPLLLALCFDVMGWPRNVFSWQSSVWM